MLVSIANRLDERRDSGSTLVSVLIIMLVLTIGGLVLSSIVVNTTGMLGASRNTVQSRAAADAGIADVVTRGQRGEDICNHGGPYVSSGGGDYQVSVLCDTSTVVITSTGSGTGGGRTVTEARYVRNGVTKKLAGAVVSANGSLNVSSLNITALAIDGDIVLDDGDFDCNNSMEIYGDLIVRDGSVQLSNACRIHGDVVASGFVQIQNNAVGVDGDIYTMGDFTLTTSATIGGEVFAAGNAKINSGGQVTGSVTAAGTVSVDGAATSIGGSVWSGGKITFNAATVSGTVTTASTEGADFYNGKVGGIRIAGPLAKLQGTKVTHDVVSSSTSSSEIQAGVTIGGDLVLAGSWFGVAPTVSGTVKLNQSGVSAPTAPTVTLPWALTADAFSWIDLSFVGGWSGYTTIPIPGCDFQGSWSSANRAVINALSTPTVVDGRSCDNVNMYDATFDIKTNVTFLLSKASAQRLKLNSADGTAHTFNIITPDNIGDEKPNCVTDSPHKTPGTIDIGDVIMDPKLTGIAYSPCTVHIGQSSGGGRWNGQVYAGKVEWGGNSSPRMQLDYREVSVPGFPSPSSGGGGPEDGSVVGALISLRDS